MEKIEKKIEREKEKEEWMENVISNIQSLSRTLKGISDTSSSAEKPKLEIEEGDALAEKTFCNLQHALEYLWENRRKIFKSPDEMREFIDNLATIVSEGLLKEGQSLYRTWETKFGQTKPEDIETEYQKFCEWLFKTIESSDAVETAALIEKRLDGEIHPFADGCGRTAKLLSAFILMRHGSLLPKYKDRKEYYKEINKNDDEWIAYYESLFK